MKKQITGFFLSIAGAAAGAMASKYVLDKTIEQKAQKVDKFKSYYNILNQWLLLKQEGKSLERYFLDNNYREIAIYGMGEMGNRLYDELKHSEIKVKFGIDKNAASTYSEIEVKDLEDEWPPVDAVVVTAVFAFDEAESVLKSKIDAPIISLEDVVFEA